MAKEQTGPQLTGIGTVRLMSADVLLPVMPATYNTYRGIASDPTIALAMKLSHAPIIDSSWTIESEDDINDDVIQFCQKQMNEIRDRYIRSALYGTTVFGWQSYELIWGKDENLMTTVRLKPLLQDITKVIMNRMNGEMVGVRQYDYFSIEQLFPTIKMNKVLFVNLDQEGDYYYGKSRIESIRETFNDYNRASVGAQSYDERIAGSMFVIYYPVGTSTYNGEDDVDNQTIATGIANSIKASGVLCVPNIVNEYIKDLNVAVTDIKNFGWRIEYLSDSTARQPSFIDRLKYLDSKLVRGLIMPERAVLEGSYGTKAESETHQNLALTYFDSLHKHLTKSVQRLLDLIVEQNYGIEMVGKLTLIASPLIDAEKEYLRTIYSAIASADAKNIDTDALKDLLSIPKAEQITPIGEEPNAPEEENEEEDKETDTTDKDIDNE